MASLSPSTSALPKGQESEEELFADTEFVPAKNGGSWRIDLPDFLRGITKPKTVRGGQAPKRRGPKPDSKPALTRRQELNRMAQRTHRERKDFYAKDLEWRVTRMRDAYIHLVKTKESYRAENQEMARLLRAHGIPYQTQDEWSNNQEPSSTERSTSYGSNSIFSGTRSQTLGASPSGTSLSAHSPSGNVNLSPYSPIGTAISSDTKPSSTENVKALVSQERKLNHDQIAVNLILALEKYCQEHKTLMCHRGQNENPEELSGHALMASCPPPAHLEQDPTDMHYHQLPDVPIPELWKLLDLAQELPLHGEMTPVHVVKMLRDHARYSELTETDFSTLTGCLYGVTRCYGFGAVLADFEVRDIIEDLFAKKDLANAMTQNTGNPVANGNWMVQANLTETALRQN